MSQFLMVRQLDLLQHLLLLLLQQQRRPALRWRSFLWKRSRPRVPLAVQ
jgi:hypothetical protein